jgi:DUF4097 and DUF4098 domain-containing protein YvlB
VTRILWAVLLFAPARLAAQASLPYTFAAAPDVSMRIWVPTGTVRVETWSRDSIRVSGTIGRGAHFFGGGAGRGAKLGVENYDSSNTTLAHGDLVVTVPSKAHVWIKMTDGRVAASNTAGELDVITVTGAIAVQDAEGVVSVETIDADVNLTRVSGEVRARSGGGRIMLARIMGTLTAATVSGAIDLTGASLQDARLETIGGGIIIHGTVAPEALLDLETHNGPITLYLDRQTLPSLTLSSRAGTVKNPLGLGNGGAGRIVARSFKGNINVVAGSGIEGRKSTAPP